MRASIAATARTIRRGVAAPVGAAARHTGVASRRRRLVTLDSAVRTMRGRFTRARLPRFTIGPL
jgi:hypothetical protein